MRMMDYQQENYRIRKNHTTNRYKRIIEGTYIHQKEIFKKNVRQLKNMKSVVMYRSCGFYMVSVLGFGFQNYDVLLYVSNSGHNDRMMQKSIFWWSHVFTSAGGCWSCEASNRTWEYYVGKNSTPAVNRQPGFRRKDAWSIAAWYCKNIKITENNLKINEQCTHVINSKMLFNIIDNSEYHNSISTRIESDHIEYVSKTRRFSVRVPFGGRLRRSSRLTAYYFSSICRIMLHASCWYS